MKITIEITRHGGNQQRVSGQEAGITIGYDDDMLVKGLTI
jgi:hypothetical protein